MTSSVDPARSAQRRTAAERSLVLHVRPRSPGAADPAVGLRRPRQSISAVIRRTRPFAPRRSGHARQHAPNVPPAEGPRPDARKRPDAPWTSRGAAAERLPTDCRTEGKLTIRNTAIPPPRDGPDRSPAWPRGRSDDPAPHRSRRADDPPEGPCSGG